MAAFRGRARAVRAAPNVSPSGNPPSFSVSGIPGAKRLQTGTAVPTGLGASSVVFLGGGALETAERGPSFLPRKLGNLKGPQAPEGFTTGQGGGVPGGGSGGSGGGSGTGSQGGTGRGFRAGQPLNTA